MPDAAGRGRGAQSRSSKTVEVHRANIKVKLQLKTMAELIRYAVRWVESEHGA